MSAHDKLEHQLRASVARSAVRRPARRLGLWSRSRGVPVLIVVGSTAVAVGVAVFALVALHPRQTSSAHPGGCDDHASFLVELQRHDPRARGKRAPADRACTDRAIRDI